MFGKRRKEKKAAKKAQKAEEEAAGNIQLLRVAPRGTFYTDVPAYPLAHRNPQLSRSMDVLNGHPSRSPPESLPPVEPVQGKNKKKKKSNLRRAASLAEDGMLGQHPQERYRRSNEAPVYYYNEPAPVYYIDEQTDGDLQIHPSSRPRYLVTAVPPHHTMEPHHVRSVPGTPVLYHHPQRQPRQYHQAQVAPAPPTSTYKMESPTATHPPRHYRNVHIIPRTGGQASPAKSAQRRPVSHFFPQTSSELRTPSPTRSPSPSINNTGPRRGKGKAIRIIEGWDEPTDDRPQVVQSHEVGVAPKSRVMDEFNSRTTSSPFSITINDRDGYSSSVIPTSGDVRLREPSRKNKARPVSAAPWISGKRDNDEPVQRQNGHVMVDFSE